MDNKKDKDLVDRVAMYQDSELKRLNEFEKSYPIFSDVISELLAQGIEPEKITFEFVEKTIKENREYRIENLKEVLKPSRRVYLWEFGGTK